MARFQGISGEMLLQEVLHRFSVPDRYTEHLEKKSTSAKIDMLMYMLPNVACRHLLELPDDVGLWLLSALQTFKLECKVLLSVVITPCVSVKLTMTTRQGYTEWVCSAVAVLCCAAADTADTGSSGDYQSRVSKRPRRAGPCCVCLCV